MHDLDLSNNKFSGDFPPYFGNNANNYAMTLNIANNNLTGTLPAAIANFIKLTTLDIR